MQSPSSSTRHGSQSATQNRLRMTPTQAPTLPRHGPNPTTNHQFTTRTTIAVDCCNSTKKSLYRRKQNGQYDCQADPLSRFKCTECHSESLNPIIILCTVYEIITKLWLILRLAYSSYLQKDRPPRQHACFVRTCTEV